jgi:hypothetical protein
MTQNHDPLAGIQARQHLEQVNEFVLHGAGEIADAPGKLSLVWIDAQSNIQHYLAIKAAGEDILLINGRRYSASVEGLREGLRDALAEIHRSG